MGINDNTSKIKSTISLAKIYLAKIIQKSIENQIKKLKYKSCFHNDNQFGLPSKSNLRAEEEIKDKIKNGSSKKTERKKTKKG